MSLARDFKQRGFSAFKIAAVMAPGAIELEVAQLRCTLGEEPRIMVDMHWMFAPAEAISLLHRLERHRLYFAEAPCKPEDVDGLAQVASSARVPIAAGEEWRTVWDAAPRLARRAVTYVQPEMGHTGVTQFMRIAQLAAAHHIALIPHATIGTGIFLAASLQASAASSNVLMHEYQPSVFDRNSVLLEGGLRCADGAYDVSDTPGIGVRPTDEMLRHMQRLPD
jgi:galactonate dehydratase